MADFLAWVLVVIVAIAFAMVHFVFGFLVRLMMEDYIENPLHTFITILFWPYGVIVLIFSWLLEQLHEIIEYYNDKRDWK